jgi:hypothetical protein
MDIRKIGTGHPKSFEAPVQKQSPGHGRVGYKKMYNAFFFLVRLPDPLDQMAGIPAYYICLGIMCRIKKIFGLGQAFYK